MTHRSSIQAVILAGGLGVRLRPLTFEIPKPMVPVAGRPYLEHQLRLLAHQGIRDVVILTGHLGEQIESFFGDGSGLGLSIRYSREETPLGTGGALHLAEALLSDSFLVIYGDSYLPIEYADITEKMIAADVDGVLVVYDNRHGDTNVRPNIALDPDGFVARYQKDAPGAEGLTHVDAGVAVLRKGALALIRGGARKWSLEDELYTELIARRRLLACESEQRFYDIGTPDRLAAFERFLTS